MDRKLNINTLANAVGAQQARKAAAAHKAAIEQARFVCIVIGAFAGVFIGLVCF